MTGIYVVTVMALGVRELTGSPMMIKTRHPIGIFDSLESCKESVTLNDSDIAEGNYYKYAVIEEFEHFGMYPMVKEHQWYEYDEKLDEFVQCEKPECLKQIVNFAIG